MKEIEAESAGRVNKSAARKASSDEDAILVESGGPDVNDKGSVRKKRSKK